MGHVACMEENKHAYTIFLSEHHNEGKKVIPNFCWRPLERERAVYKVRRNFKELGL
jgi:hypothetical protein